jgi:hypothetical protein
MHDRYHNHVRHALLVTSTRAVRKFLRDHDGVPIPELDRVLVLLEADDFKAASNVFKTIHLGPHSIADWFPPAKFANEDPEYAQAVWNALIERWHRLMTTAAG